MLLLILTSAISGVSLSTLGFPIIEFRYNIGAWKTRIVFSYLAQQVLLLAFSIHVNSMHAYSMCQFYFSCFVLVVADVVITEHVGNAH